MKLEDQVAPLALARRMKELGFPQETFLGWDAYDGTPILVVRQSEAVLGIDWVPAEIECAAPTVAEIGEALPPAMPMSSDEVDSDNHDHTLDNAPHDDARWCIHYRFDGSPMILHTPSKTREGFCGGGFHGATEAEARACLWIALAEAGAIPLAPQPPRI